MKQKGYSLIELMTTIAVASILITVAMPGMQSFRMNSHMTGEVNDLVSAMHLARNTAITVNSRVTLCASSDGDNCGSTAWDEGWIVFIDLDRDQSVDPGETIVGVGTDTDGITISSTQFSNFLVYRPNGRAMKNVISESSGQFNICDRRGAQYAKAVVIDLSGRPRTADKTSPGVTIGCPSS